MSTVQAAVDVPQAPALRRPKTLGMPAMLGPAFVAGIAYVDPGNVAANVTAGSAFGYRLVWVIVAANVAAVLIQGLAAKVGLATGRNLAEVTADRSSRRTRIALWLQAEIIAMATDLAEVVGGAIALQLLFGVPLLLGAVATAAAAAALVSLRDRGYRPYEAATGLLFMVVAAGFAFVVWRSGPSPREVAHGLVPGFAGSDSLLLATAMVGATIMPHAVYAHSALTKHRHGAPASRLLRGLRIDIGIAMSIAGCVNLAMVVIGAAALPHATVDISGMYADLGRALGGAAAFVFAVALLSSGLASSGVGTFAGEIAMTGYLRRRIPRPVRRGITLLPSLAVLGLGLGVTDALIVSQVVLCFGLPATLALLVAVTRNPTIMGALVNRRRTTHAAAALTILVSALDALLLIEIFR